jgi:antitoxin component of MazEF toxin-antitoxin module
MIMSVTTYQGTVENGQVRLAGNVRLPENAKVYVIVPDVESNASAKKFDLAEMISGMPPDYQASEESFGEPVGKEEW